MPLYIEQCSLPDDMPGTLAQAVAAHLYARLHGGCVVVVVDQPFVFMRVLRKKWLKLMRLAQRERARTMDGRRIRELVQQITRMQTLAFTAKPPAEMPHAGVYCASAEWLAQLPQGCHTAYLTGLLSPEQLAILQARLAANGVVVEYRHRL